MLIEFMEIKDFFENPDEIIMLAKQQSFVEKDAHYHNANKDIFYNGVRSKTMKDIDAELYRKILVRVFEKVIDKRFKEDLCKVKIEYGFKADIYFHVMREQDKFNDAWIHKDTSSILAGVVYLNPNPRPNTGTLLYVDGDDKEPMVVDNEFNKMIIYDASYLHAPQAGFGTDINDSRLTLVFFMGEISFRIGLVEHMINQEETNT
jgi:hypothetical protein